MKVFTDQADSSLLLQSGELRKGMEQSQKRLTVLE